MKNKKIYISIISITIICFITLIFNIKTDFDNKSKINIVILSAMDNVRNEKLNEMLQNKFPKYDIVINPMSDVWAENTFKRELRLGTSDMVIGLEKNSLDKIIKSLEKEDYKVIEKFKYDNKEEYYKVINNSKLAVVIDKKYNSPKIITYEYILENSKNNKLAIADLRDIYESQNFCFGVKEKYGEEKALKYIIELNKNIKKYPTNNDGVVNLLKKGEMEIGIIPYYLANNEFNNSKKYDIREIENNSYVEETLFLILDRKPQKEIKEVLNFINSEYLEVEKNELIKNQGNTQNLKDYKERKIFYNKINFEK